MLDLKDGETIQVQGSASKPYQIKFVAGVYSCSCPAWRNQSLPIDRRTCKHISNMRGLSVEESRAGLLLSDSPKKVPNKAPPLLLAESWDGVTEPTDWWLSEKLDGVRAYWDGKQFLSRQGNRFFAPAWFTEGLPLEPLDGELWIGRKMFQRTVSIVRRQDGGDLWKEVRFLVFDAPAHNGSFEERLGLVKLIMKMNQPEYAQLHQHDLCQGFDHLKDELTTVEFLGGEGLMLRQPGSLYVAGRSSTLLKVKTFKDAEARVIGYEPGAGRHRGRVGALSVELANGIRFAVGTALTDLERDNPPSIGSIITFKYQELSDGGVPRFPSYVGVRSDIPKLLFQGEALMQTAGQKARRFEFVEGSSSKFWEIRVSGTEVHLLFGRIGTQGQSNTKRFPDKATAEKHADKVIAEKLAKGYLEVAA